MPYRVSSYDYEWPVGKKHFPDTKKKSSFKSNRLVGVEWEYCGTNSITYEGIKAYDPIRKWARKWYGGNHYDGSCGYEAVTSPIGGDNISTCLTELSAAFTKSKAYVDDRASIHVHVNVKDFEWADMERLIKVYSKIEMLLYALGGDGRVKNDYCSPCGSKYTKAVRKGREDLLRVTFQPRSFIRRSRRTMFVDGSAQAHAQKAEKHDGGRYKGLNIIPWIVAKRDKKNDCTVEFRIHENTLDVKRVIGWVHLLVRLVDWVKKATPEMVRRLPINQITALAKMCPDSKNWIRKRLTEWAKNENTNKITVNDKGVFTLKTSKQKEQTNTVSASTPYNGWRVSFGGSNVFFTDVRVTELSELSAGAV